MDPRIQQFKEAEKLAKEAKRKEKEDALKHAQEEQRLKEEQERHQQEALEQEQKLKQKLEKEERERQKKLIKQERKTIKQLAKDISIQLANDLEHLLLSMVLEDLINFKERLESATDISAVIEQEIIRIDGNMIIFTHERNETGTGIKTRSGKKRASITRTYDQGSFSKGESTMVSERSDYSHQSG